jgi:hypothetical protein
LASQVHRTFSSPRSQTYTNRLQKNPVVWLKKSLGPADLSVQKCKNTMIFEFMVRFIGQLDHKSQISFIFFRKNLKNPTRPGHQGGVSGNLHERSRPCGLPLTAELPSFHGGCGEVRTVTGTASRNARYQDWASCSNLKFLVNLELLNTQSHAFRQKSSDPK